MQCIVRHCRDYLIAIILIGAGLLSSASAGFIQQGPKLVGTSSSGLPHQGGAVALSGDGNTAIVGGWGIIPVSEPPGFSHAAVVSGPSRPSWSAPMS
jgi:hypothetical protein